MMCKTFAILGLTGLSAVLAPVPSLQAQQVATDTHATTSRAGTAGDTALRIGRLPNGLTYYIRANAKPEKQVQLLLVVKAGSLQEDDDQRGMAHFLEHMAFNGTRRFKEHELISYLESIGVRFGADLNASTAWDRTMYTIQVPAGKPQQLLKALDIVSDWTDGITFDSAEVVAERGVIVEEWRSRLRQGEHIRAAHDSVMFNGSPHGRRDPIGTVQSIQSTTAESLKRFYRDWYRPNLMAVVAVGDLDPAVIEKAIVERFSHLKNPVPERPLEPAPIPGNTEPLFSLVQDSLVSSTTISIGYKVPFAKGDPLVLRREALAFSIFLNTVNKRLAELTRTPNPPFRSANVGARVLVPGQPVFSIGVGTNSGSPLNSVELVLTEVERVVQQGVSAAAIEEFRASTLKSMENSAANKEPKPSMMYAQAYANHFVTGERIRDQEEEDRVTREALALVTNDDVKEAAAIWRLKENRIFMVSAPVRADVRVPELQSLLGVIDDVERMELPPYTEAKVRSDPLMPDLPEPGKIVARKTLDEGIYEWTLSNGIRVLLRPTDLATDLFHLSGESPGGFYRNLDSIDFVPASLATTIVGMSGSGSFTAAELRKSLEGKEIVSVGANIGPINETASLMSSTRDAESALQALNLILRFPRIDTAAIETYRTQMREAIANHIRTADDDYRDTVWLTMAEYMSARRAPMGIDPEKIDAEKSLQVFRDRFADMSDFRFVLVGSFKLDDVEPLIERYIASLPGHGRVERDIPVDSMLPHGVIRKKVYGAKINRSATTLHFGGLADDDLRTPVQLAVLEQILQSRLFDRLREQLAGTYSPQVIAVHSRGLKASYSLDVRFTSAPERADELVNATLEILQDLRTNPVSEAELQKVREQMLLGFEQQLQADPMWAVRMHLFDDLKIPFSKIRDDSLIRNLSPADVLATAQRYITLDKYFHFELAPDPSREAK